MDGRRGAPAFGGSGDGDAKGMGEVVTMGREEGGAAAEASTE